MKTAQQIRMDNFRLLLDEAGSQAALARRTGIPSPYINQLAKGTKLASGRERSLGDETARRLERGMDRPMGWMDKDHSMSMLFSELNGPEGQLVTLFRNLDDAGRDQVLRLTNELFAKLHPTPTKPRAKH